MLLISFWAKFESAADGGFCLLESDSKIRVFPYGQAPGIIRSSRMSGEVPSLRAYKMNDLAYAPDKRQQVPRALFLKGLLIVLTIGFALNTLVSLGTMPTDRSPWYYLGCVTCAVILIALPIWTYLEISQLQRALRKVSEEIEELRSRKAHRTGD